MTALQHVLYFGLLDIFMHIFIGNYCETKKIFTTMSRRLKSPSPINLLLMLDWTLQRFFSISSIFLLTLNGSNLLLNFINIPYTCYFSWCICFKSSFLLGPWGILADQKKSTFMTASQDCPPSVSLQTFKISSKTSNFLIEWNCKSVSSLISWHPPNPGKLLGMNKWIRESNKILIQMW